VGAPQGNQDASALDSNIEYLFYFVKRQAAFAGQNGISDAERPTGVPTITLCLAGEGKVAHTRRHHENGIPLIDRIEIIRPPCHINVMAS
jgi:hypothetical protein